MIKEIFLPEIIGTKRLYSQQILGFAIKEQTVTCIHVYAKRTKTFIENLIKQPIEQGTPDNFNHLAAQAIKKILSQIKKYDQIRIAIPSSLIIFKELQISLTDHDKIRMILDYEIESMLPFSIDEAVTDFIITKQSKKENSSQILVAAIRKQDLENILDIYKTAGIEPKSITIDLFAIYGLYQQMPEYQNIKNSSVIIDMDSYSTQVAFLEDGELRLSRIIPRGIMSVASSIGEEINIDIKQVKQKIEAFGFQKTNDEVYNKALQKHAINLFNDIQFTLNSFGLKLNTQKGISKILFTGTYSQIKDLAHFCNNLLQISCEIFNCEKIFDNKIFKNRTKNIANTWAEFIVAMGTACPSVQQLYFNLRRKEFALVYNKIVKKQLSTSLLIIIAIFSFIIFKGYFQIQRLTTEIKTIEDKEMVRLKEVFPENYKFPKQLNFRSLSQKAEKIVADKLDLWGPFSHEKLHPLQFLQELTNIIDKRRFDISIEEVSISEEEGVPKIIVEGFFKSKTGTDHFTNFGAELEPRFNESKFFKYWDENEPIKTKPLEDDGLPFIATLKPKEY